MEILPCFNTFIVVIFSFLLLFSFYYFLALISNHTLPYANKNNNSKMKGKLPPHLPGAWPLFGHFPLLSRSRLPHETLSAMADRLGPIFTIRLGLNPALVVSSSVVAKELFSNHDANVTSRPPLAAAKRLTYNYAMFPFTPSHGPYWRDMRKTSVSELLSNRAVEQRRHVMIQEVENRLKDLYKKGSSVGRVVIDFKEWFGELNLNLLMRIVVGKKYEFGGDEEGGRCRRLINEMFHYWGTLVVRDAVPFLGWMDVGGHEKVMKRIAMELDDIVEGWLREHKCNKNKGTILGHDNELNYDGDKDFMDVMDSFLQGKSFDGFDADTITKATSLSMVAGSETVTVAMTWALTLLLNNPNALRKAQQELDTHVGKERMVKHTDISKLVYMEAIVKETLRLYPPASIPAPRQFTEDCNVGDYFVPKGTWLLVNLKKIQTDPQVWVDPLEFKPERFLPTHDHYKNVDVMGLNFELTPFGHGRRACPAMSFSIQMVNLTLASLVHAFEFTVEGDGPIDMTQKAGLTNIKETPLQVIVSPRLSPTCFE